ncbi:DUF1735 and LamG domain-containing protein [Bacteroides acidifaciens]|uniref:DUF1735 and LamG domain-containing protein n=1 Tax=Bacteroides acidifaciens TaxID=85831 RepID=UPI0030151472
MKKYILYSLLVTLLGACDFVSSEGGNGDNAIYMSNPNNVLSMLVNDKGGSIAVTPRLALMADEPVSVTIAVDENTLQEYNQENGLNLKSVAPEDFVFVASDGRETHGEATVVIEKGQVKGLVEVRVPSIDENKYPHSGRFAIPLRIVSASHFEVLSSPRTAIVLLNRELVTSIAYFKKEGPILFKPKTPYTEPMSEWTIQLSAIFPALSNSNTTTISMQNPGGGEFYTRITAANGIQVKNGRDGADTWTKKPLKTNVWLHITYVYKDSSISVYVNGEFQKTFETSPLYMGPNSGWYVGNNTWKKIYLREVRFWDKALKEADILDKLYLPQDVSDPNLQMYAPFAKPDDNGMPLELTGNWTVSYMNPSYVPQLEYIDNVLFPADKLEFKEVDSADNNE